MRRSRSLVDWGPDDPCPRCGGTNVWLGGCYYGLREQGKSPGPAVPAGRNPAYLLCCLDCRFSARRAGVPGRAFRRPGR